MLSRFVQPLRAAVAFLIIAVSTVLHATPLLALALFKLVLPLPAWRDRITAMLSAIGHSWIAVNSWLLQAVGTRTTVQQEGELDRRGWYLVICNHQSWADIPLLQQAFNTRIPLLKFFLKRELIWVPLLGLAWWALDFPFMRRYTRAQLEKHPEWRGKDMQATRAACEKFRRIPVSVMNFVEGTRFTPAKHAQQGSPYRHLLLPRAGGTAFVLQAMGGLFQALVDVTLVYPGGRPSMYDLLAGRVREVRIIVRQRPIPPELLDGDYENDAAFRARFQEWLNALWRDKDDCIGQQLARRG
ncbi:acyltransferase [Tahibacter harae]|uniref:Acyltransferase n=1 Tax=Tahibacter harae TaxID=2963937 RepID=A0ABT1QLA2_9GAMM|nr:acyltransferase [Tahibacter harae]MCQ4163296.1 acyltransferase [Tahibacter harae]